MNLFASFVSPSKKIAPSDLYDSITEYDTPILNAEEENQVDTYLPKQSIIRSPDEPVNRAIASKFQKAYC